ncbi:MAG: transporter [Chloroflexota bacterium]
MGRLLVLYLHLVGARLRAQMQYRVSLVLEIAGNFLLAFIDFLAIAVIFAHLPRLRGWSLGEVAFLYGTSYLAFKLADLAVGHLDTLGPQVQSGQLDPLLVRPLGALFQVITADFSLRQVGGLVQGVVVLGLALTRLEIAWTPGRVLVFVLMPVCGALIFAAVWIAGHTLAFWTVRGGEAVNAVTYGGNMLTTYPLEIFAPWLRRLLAFAVPLAFVNYLPSLYILDKPDPFGLPAVLRFASPLVAAVALVVAGRIWNAGLRRYRSTGS